MHPSLRILAVVLLAAMVQFMSLRMLGVIAALLLMPTWYASRSSLATMLYRSRWLLLTILLVYSFTIPGEYLRGWSAIVAPTYEGMAQGCQQAVRLVVMLVAIALVMGTTRREMLMAGIYQLMQPLRLLGIAPERFTARLWLTLHYVEVMPRPAAGSFWQRFSDVDGVEAPAMEKIPVPMQPFCRFDQALVLVMLAAVVLGWAL